MENYGIGCRVTFQGAYVLSTIVFDQYIEHQYMGYTKKEAKKLFQEKIAKIIEERG